MNIDLSKIVETLKNVTDDEISNTLGDWKIDETSFCNALLINGLAKKIPTIKHTENEKPNVIWGQIILRAYAVFVCMRNDILESNLMLIKEWTPLYLFKKVFEQGKKGEAISTESPTGLCQRIRNSISHGTFDIDRNNGEITFKDYEIAVVVEGYEVTQFCGQIERLYLKCNNGQSH